MRHVVHHRADPAAARTAVERAIATYQERFPAAHPAARWLDEDHASVEFEVRGIRITGQIALEPGRICFDARVPLVFRPFVGRALHVLEAEVERWIERVEPDTMEGLEE